MLTLNALLSGCDGGVGATGADGSVCADSVVSTGADVSLGGLVAHAASAVSARTAIVCEALVTEPDAQYIDLRDAQAAAQHIEFVEVISRANAYAMISPFVNRNALNL